MYKTWLDIIFKRALNIECGIKTVLATYFLKPTFTFYFLRFFHRSLSLQWRARWVSPSTLPKAFIVLGNLSRTRSHTLSHFSLSFFFTHTHTLSLSITPSFTHTQTHTYVVCSCGIVYPSKCSKIFLSLSLFSCFHIQSSWSLEPVQSWQCQIADTCPCLIPKSKYINK